MRFSLPYSMKTKLSGLSALVLTAVTCSVLSFMFVFSGNQYDIFQSGNKELVAQEVCQPDRSAELLDEIQELKNKVKVLEGSLQDIQSVFGIAATEWKLTTDVFSKIAAKRQPSVKYACTDELSCAKKLFQNVHWSFYNQQLLPVGPVWSSGSIERIYIDKFLWESAVPIAQPNSRCIEWDLGYTISHFNSICSVKDSLSYHGDKSRKSQPHGSGTTYFGDLHDLKGVIPDSSFDIVLATQVYEHLHDPKMATAELFRITKNGGFAVVTAPHISPFHLVPDDFFRYTDHGLPHLLEEAGFKCEVVKRWGNTGVTSALLQGFHTPSVTPEDINVTPDDNFVQLAIIARKPGK